MSKYRVTYKVRNPRRDTTKATDFEVDPRIKNKFILHIDRWSSIEVVIEPKKWWEFWR